MRYIVLFMVSFSTLFGDPLPSAEVAEAKSTEQGKTLSWKASCFAGATLLAVLAGIVVIAIDGGTPNPSHKDHHHPNHRGSHPNHHPPHPY